MALSIIILAAGQGTRMKSARPKVLHLLAGKPLLQHVVDCSKTLGPDQIIVVVGHHSEQVKAVMANQNLRFVEQSEQLGTGHAVAQCLDALNSGNDVLVLYGDVPMTSGTTLARVIDKTNDVAVNILSFFPINAQGYGRIIRSEDGSISAIVEEKDASASEKNITESNSGIFFIDGSKITKLIQLLDNNNAQAEYYLTDIVKHAVQNGEPVTATHCDDPAEVYGVNNQSQLAEVERLFRKRKANFLMENGVKLYDPLRIDIRGNLKVGADVTIDINCIFEGDVELGDNVSIGANCVIRNSRIDTNSVINPMTYIEDAVIGKQVVVGPFARIRPGTGIADEAKIGNFVEIKNSHIGIASKVSHLSYIGDTEMGDNVNIGAGTITCNYDGVNKSKTIIEDGVFIGSNTQLVAPVKISRGATIGAGSVITKDSPPDQLTLSRAKQITINSWVKPAKKQRNS